MTSFNLLTEGVLEFWSKIVLNIPYLDGLAIILSPQFYTKSHTGFIPIVEKESIDAKKF